MYDLRHVIDSLCSIVLFGPGEARYGDKGVHLSLFSSVARDVEKKSLKDVWGITTWLYKSFSLDSEQYEPSVMALFNRSHLVFGSLCHLKEC
jgi:hypothetical protein